MSRNRQTSLYPNEISNVSRRTNVPLQPIVNNQGYTNPYSRHLQKLQNTRPPTAHRVPKVATVTTFPANLGSVRRNDSLSGPMYSRNSHSTRNGSPPPQIIQQSPQRMRKLHTGTRELYPNAFPRL